MFIDGRQRINANGFNTKWFILLKERTIIRSKPQCSDVCSLCSRQSSFIMSDLVGPPLPSPCCPASPHFPMLTQFPSDPRQQPVSTSVIVSTLLQTETPHQLSQCWVSLHMECVHAEWDSMSTEWTRNVPILQRFHHSMLTQSTLSLTPRWLSRHEVSLDGDLVDGEWDSTSTESPPKILICRWIYCKFNNWIYSKALFFCWYRFDLCNLM